jgi:Polyketide synthase modules and related proteins
MEQSYENDIAIIGMSGRFPRANNIDAYWQNLVKGVNSVRKAEKEEIAASGISDKLLNHKRFVNASSKLEDAKYFDADFFALSNTEATLMDPQIRLLLQTSWHALEDAGYATNNHDISVGNFCGMSTNSYLFKIIETNALAESVDPLLYRILNGKDFLATWISYKLNLTGPTMSVQTACSTSLLAVHLACQSLLNQECSMALAGGVCFGADDSIGYIHTPESIYSKDGVCRPFDKDATGTVMGDGVGSIVLKRAEDAIKDKDHIYALIKGTAVNNDGANKQGYTTPSVNFQRDVVLEALAVADIHPDTIGMVEAHGTGTLIGDPIEVAALTEAFRAYTGKKQYCAIGSVKSNIGHLDTAAGVASIIKAALCVNKGVIVPSINFSRPNPSLQLEGSPFYVSQNCASWPDHFNIRRAGISSLGVGGTNVHVILEEPPVAAAPTSTKGAHVIGLSALNEESLDLQKHQLAAHIRESPDLLLEDIAFTRLYGRKMMPHRFSVLCNSKTELVAQLSGAQNEKCFEGHGQLSEGVFLFPGQGSQYAGMAKGLYADKEAFRRDMDYCFDYAKSLSSVDFKEIIFLDDSKLLDKTENTQVALFIVEYCLAKELLRSGIKPGAIIGHSLGEYVAACIVGCLSLEDALKLVYHRGKLMGMMPEGDMVLVRMAADELRPLLLDSVSICVYNTPSNLVIGGNTENIAQQIKVFDMNGVKYRKLNVSHAYHTMMMRGVLGEYEKVLSQVKFNHFEAKVFSTSTGKLIAPKLFCSSQYWLDQIMNPVKFSNAVEDTMNYLSNPVFIEVGPGSGLSSFVKKIFSAGVGIVNLLPRPSAKSNDLDNFYQGKALLYVKGLVFDLPESQQGKRISLPGYVFSRNYFWKPNINVAYTDFKAIKESYHHTNKKYLSDRLRFSIEIQTPGHSEIPDELLDDLNDLHLQYITGVKQLILGGAERVGGIIEVVYNEKSLLENENALPKSKEFGTKRNIGNVFVEPSTEIEKTIATYWEGVLGYEPAGILDSYFKVGGNSLLATKLLTQLSDRFEIFLSFKELSENPTIKELATLIESKINILQLVEDIELDNDENFIEL